MQKYLDSRNESVCGHPQRSSEGFTLWVKKLTARGAWVAQWVERPTSAQVMISRSVGSSPALGSVLTAQSLELLQVLCLPLSLPLPYSCAVSPCLRNK